MRLSALPPDSSKVTTTKVPFRSFSGKRFIEELFHPRAGDLDVGVVAVVIHVGRVEGIGDQPLAGVLHEKVVGLAGVDTNHAVAPLRLHFAKTEKRYVASRVVAAFLGHMLRRNVPWASSVGQLLGVLLEIETGGDEAIGDGLVSSVRGIVDLVVGKQTSAAMNAEVGSRHHRQVVGIGRVKHGMEVGQAGATCSQFGKALVLARDFVVDVFKHDDENAIEMVCRGRVQRHARLPPPCRPGTSSFEDEWTRFGGAGVMLWAETTAVVKKTVTKIIAAWRLRGDVENTDIELISPFCNIMFGFSIQ